MSPLKLLNFYSFISYGISVWGLDHSTTLDQLMYELQKNLSLKKSLASMYAVATLWNNLA